MNAAPAFEPEPDLEPARDERLERFVELRRTGCPKLRDELVAQHLMLARHLASRFANRGVPFDDLFQVASVGLVNAVDRFDPTYGSPFAAFAAPTILGEIKRHFRDRAWDLRVPRRLQELHLELHAVIGRLTQELGHSPSVGELAAATRSSEEEIVEAIEAGRAFNTSSIDGATSLRAELEIEYALHEDDAAMEQVDERLLVAEVIETLPPRDRLIVRLRYWERLSQSEIANRLGISQMHVSRLLSRCHDQLQIEIGENPLAG